MFRAACLWTTKSRPGVAETVDFAAIKLGYYGGMRHLNNGILPKGPELDFAAPHDRDRFAK